MIQRIRGNLSFANVTSMMALMVALGGTSYAAVTLPHNSVGSAQIKPSGVKNSDLGASSVTSAKVKDGSLLSKDFALGQIPAGPAGLAGAAGATGATGATGPAGPIGPTGTTGPATVQSFTATADLIDGQKASYDVYCPAGQQAIAGGARGDDLNSDATSLTSSRPSISAANTEPPANGQGFLGWRITVENPPGGVNAGIRPTVWVVCVNAP